MFEPRLQLHRAGDSPALRHPQSGQAQNGQGHCPLVTSLFGQLIGLIEALTAGSQVTVLFQRMGPGRERGGKTADGISDELQPTG